MITTSYTYSYKRFIGISSLRYFDVRMRSHKNFIVGFGFRIKISICTKFEKDKANIMKNMQVSPHFHSVPLSEQKVPMATSGDIENCHHMKTDPQKCKFKFENFYLNTMWYCRGIKKVR